MKAIHISPNCYPLDFHFLFGEMDEEFFDSYCEDHNMPRRPLYDNEKHDAFQTCLSNNDVVVWMEQEPKKASQIGTLTHEITHAVADAGRILGFLPSEGSEEFYAYMIGWLTREVLIKTWDE